MKLETESIFSAGLRRFGKVRVIIICTLVLSFLAGACKKEEEEETLLSRTQTGHKTVVNYTDHLTEDKSR